MLNERVEEMHTGKAYVAWMRQIEGIIEKESESVGWLADAKGKCFEYCFPSFLSLLYPSLYLSLFSRAHLNIWDSTYYYIGFTLLHPF